MTGTRISSADIRHRISAKATVALTNEKLGRWQPRAVHLLAIAQRVHSHARYEPSYSMDAEVLATEIAYEQARLETALVDLPAGVRSQNFIVDTERALRDVAARLIEAQLLLRGSPIEKTSASPGADLRLANVSRPGDDRVVY